MGKFVTGSEYVWGASILVLILNIATTIPFQPSSIVYQIIMNSLTPVILFAEATNFMLSFEPYERLASFDSKFSNTGRIIMVLFFLLFFFLDLFFSNPAKSTDHASEGEDESGNQQDQPSPKSNQFNFILLLFAIFMWLSYMLEAIAEYNPAKYACEELLYYGGSPDYYAAVTMLRYFFHGLILYTLPAIFFHIFHLLLMQKIYSHVFLSAGIPKWTYFLYMIPQAILWPLSAIISYYVQQEDNLNIFISYAAVTNMFSGALLYMSLKLLFELVEEFKAEKNENHKKLRVISIVAGFFIYYFIYQFAYLKDLHSYDLPKDYKDY